MSRRRAAYAVFASNSAATVLLAAQSLILTPLYLQSFGAHLYGSWVATGDILAWLTAMDFGVPNMIMQKIGSAQGRGDAKSVGEWFAGGAVVLFAFAALVAAVAFTLTRLASHLLSTSGPNRHILLECLMLGGVATALTVANSSFIALGRGLQLPQWEGPSAILAAIGSFVATVAFLKAGAGLLSIPLGLLTRSLIAISCGATFFVRRMPAASRPFCRPRYQIIKELAIHSPALAIGSLSTALVNQSDAAIAAYLIRPEAATVLSITRRILDAVKGLVEMVGYASHAGYAHLFASGDKAKARAVYCQVFSIRLLAAVPAICGYLIFNPAFVRSWVGSANFGGLTLTALLGLSNLVTGQAYLTNILLRATGRILQGAWVSIVECAVRIPLAFGACLMIGLPGLPIASILVCSVSLVALSRWNRNRTDGSNAAIGPRVVAVHGTSLALALVCAYALRDSPLLVAAAAASFVALLSGITTLSIDSNLSFLQQRFQQIIWGKRSPTTVQ